MRKTIQILAAGLLVVLSSVPFGSIPVFAANYADVSNTMSTQAKNAPATHVIQWTLVGGDTFAAGENFAIDFSDADFTLNSIGSWQTADFSFNDGTARTIDAVSTVSGVAPTCNAGVNNVCITINTSTNMFTIVAAATYTPSAADATMVFTIHGTTAVGTGTMTNANVDTDSSIFTITGSNGDVGSGAVVIEDNAVVTVTATVNPTLTFSIGSATVALGTLTPSTTGTGSHAIDIATNASGGFAITYNGPTLTSGANTIDAYGTTGAVSSPGTEGFGINLRDNATPNIGADVTSNAGTCSYGTNYGTADTFSFQASTVTQVASATSAADCEYTASYVANISSTTAAGAYTTTLTYVATATF
jgi:hypothetical protein